MSRRQGGHKDAFTTLEAAMLACLKLPFEDCRGILHDNKFPGHYQIRHSHCSSNTKFDKTRLRNYKSGHNPFMDSTIRTYPPGGTGEPTYTHPRHLPKCSETDWSNV